MESRARNRRWFMSSASRLTGQRYAIRSVLPRCRRRPYDARVRWRFVLAIAILAFVECIVWLLAGLAQWNLAGFSLGPVYSPQAAEGARASLTEFAWGALNIVVLVAYYLRALGRRLVPGIHLAPSLIPPH